MNSKKLYLFNFCYGVINSIAISMLPLVLVDKGYNPSQVTIVLSFVFLAAVFQPIIGVVTRSITGSKKMIQIILVAVAALALAIFAVTNFALMILSVLVFSIGRLSLSPIYDSVLTIGVKKHNINYGLIRSGASLGFGLGMGLYTLISSIFGWSYPMGFVFIAVIGVVALSLISTLPDERPSDEQMEVSDEQTHIGKYVVLVIIYTLFFGGLNIRMSYFSTYFVEFDYSTTFISMATFALVIPEVIFLPLYNKLFAKYNKMLLLLITLIIGMMQVMMFTLFTESPIMLLVTSSLNGFQIMLFFPTYFGLLQQSLGPKNSAFGFIINMTTMSIFVGIFNMLVIRPLYVGIGSTIPIFYVICIMYIIALLPLGLYTIKYYNK